MFEKNNSTSIKDMLIDRIVAEGNYSENTVESIVAFQGEDLLKALREHNQIEISGFGVLSISKNRLIKKISNYESFISTSKDVEKVDRIKEALKLLNKKKCQY